MEEQNLTVVVGLYLAAKTRGEGTAKLLEAFEVDCPGLLGAKLPHVRAQVREHCRAKGLKVRSISVLHDPKDIHVACYVEDRGQGARALLTKKKPTHRGGPQGGPLGREAKGVSKKTRRAIAGNRKNLGLSK